MIQNLKYPTEEELDMNLKHLMGQQGPAIPREKQGRDWVACGVRPECDGCRIATHGFLCHFSDGRCLRYGFPPDGNG